MVSRSIRAAATALLLGSAATAGATLLMTVPAEAATVSPKVGRPLQQAQALAARGDYKGALNAVAQAQGAASTAEERSAVAQMRQYITVKQGGGTGIVADYNAGRYSAVIAAGRKGKLDAQGMQLVAQAYYLTHDYTGCSRYIAEHFGGGASESVLTLQMRCAYEAQDNEGMRSALEQLVSRTNDAKYWAQLLDTARNTKRLSDHGSLDIYRLKMLTGSLTKADDYTTLAQLALELHFAAESQAVIQKGIDAKLLSGDRMNRLMNMAKGQAATNAATWQKRLDAANKAKKGDDLVQLGEDAWGQGKYQDALNLIQAGIKKGVADVNDAQIRLGMAYLGLKQKDQAIAAFRKVQGTPAQKVDAHLWEIYARTH